MSESECENTQADHHSDDIVTVYAGQLPPWRFCGYHATHHLDDSILVARNNRMQEDALHDEDTCRLCRAGEPMRHTYEPWEPKATHEELRNVEFDHVFTVNEDGELGDAVNLHSPEVYHDDDDDITIDGVPWKQSTTWRPLVGYTGQYSYNGAVMHASEYLGGRIADDILSTPGTYVVTSVEVHPEDDDPEPEPAGWAVLRRTA